MRLALMLMLLICLSGCAGQGVKPQVAMALYDQAEARYQAGDYAGALPLYQQLARQFPRDPNLPLREGNCHAFEGRYEEAVVAYESALGIDPSFSRAWYNLSYVRAQMLAATVTRMHQNLDPRDPELVRMRQLVVDVLASFGETFELPDAPQPQVPAGDAETSEGAAADEEAGP